MRWCESESHVSVCRFILEVDLLFPRTVFAGRNTLARQWLHLLSEVLEVGAAMLRAWLSGDWNHVADELVDVQQSADTALHIAMDRHGADSYGAYTRVTIGCRRRGYYDYVQKY